MALNKLSQVVLGEILDAYGVTASLTNAIGIKYEKHDDGITEKVGEDRLGDQSGVLENLGPTFLLVTILVVLIIIIVTLLTIIARRYKIDSACSKLVTIARKKIFYSMAIRFLLMNCLKLNMVTINGVRETPDSASAILLLVVLQMMPFLLTYVLVKIEKDLNNEETQ